MSDLRCNACGGNHNASECPSYGHSRTEHADGRRARPERDDPLPRIRATVRHISGINNNCLIRNLAKALETAKGNTQANISDTTVRELRKTLCDHIRWRHCYYPDQPMGTETEQTYEDAIQMDTGHSVEEYCNSMENAGNGAQMTGDIFIFAFVQLYSHVEVRIYSEFANLSKTGVENSFTATQRIRPTPAFTITDEEWRQRVESKEKNARTCLEKARKADKKTQRAQESNAARAQRAAAQLRAQVPEEHRQYHHVHVLHVRYSETHGEEDGHYDYLEPQTHQNGAHSSGAGVTQDTWDTNRGSDDRGPPPSGYEDDQNDEQPSQTPESDDSSPPPHVQPARGRSRRRQRGPHGTQGVVMAGLGGTRHSQGLKETSRAPAGSLSLWDGHRGHIHNPARQQHGRGKVRGHIRRR
jgi:hypothetical protein